MLSIGNKNQIGSFLVGVGPVLTLLAFLISLLVAEWIFRLVPRARFSGDGLVLIQPGENQSISRISEYDSNLTELLPNIAFALGDRTYRTNSLGLNNPEIGTPKREGIRRILILGDSVTFGLMLPRDEDSFVRIVESGLKAKAGDGKQVEVINAGIPGYQLEQYASYFHWRGRALEPDMVVVNITPWDCTKSQLLSREDLGAFQYEVQNGIFHPIVLPSIPVLSDWLVANSYLYRALNFQIFNAWQHYGSPKHSFYFTNQSFCLAQVRRLQADARGIGADLLAVLHPPFVGENWSEFDASHLVERQLWIGKYLVNAAGLKFIDVLPAYRKSGIGPEGLSYDNIHPNVLGHRIIAGHLLEQLN